MKYLYLVHPENLDENEQLLVSFPTEKEAEAHLQAREAAGEPEDLFVTKVPFFDGEFPKSTVLYFESVEMDGHFIRGRWSWDENFWHYQLKPITTAKAKIIKSDNGNIKVAGTDKEAVYKLMKKEMDGHVGRL